MRTSGYVRISFFLLALLVAWGTLSASAATGVPRILTHQGRLYDANGNLLGGSGTTYCFRFGIYDDATVGAPDNKLWPSATSSAMATTVRGGVFSVGVGDVSAGGDVLDFDFHSSDSAYLNVEVASRVGGSCTDGDETFETLGPRKRIAASGYAINSALLGGFSAAQNATGTQIPVLSSGNLVLGGVNPQLNATSTNTLTIQGGTGTGNIQFFGAQNFLTATGTLSLAGIVSAQNINQFLNTTSSPVFGGVTVNGPSTLNAFSFTNATGTSLAIGIVSSTNVSSTNLTVSSLGFISSLGFSNASGTNMTASGYIETASLFVSGASTFQSIAFTNATATGGLVIQGVVSSSEARIASSTAGTLVVGGQSNLQSVSSTHIQATGVSRLATTSVSTTLTVSGQSNFQSVSSTNLAASGVLTVGGQSNLQSVSSTNFQASGQTVLGNVSSSNFTANGYIQGTSLGISGISSLQGFTFTNATGTNLSISGIASTSQLYVASSTAGRLVVGSGNLLPNSRFQVQDTVPSYFQANITNLSSSTNASADWVATNDIGTDAGHFIDLGINSSNFNSSTFSIAGANEGYLYTQSASLAIGTASSGSGVALKFFTGGTVTSSERMRIDSVGRVGIATIFPSSTLHVSGTMRISNAAANGILLDAVAGNGSYLLSVGRSASGALDFARVSVGTGTTRDQFFVSGRINTSWNYAGHDCLARNAGAATNPLATDGQYGDFYFDEDAGASGSIDTIATVSSTSGICRLNNPTTPAAGEGEWLGSGGINVTDRTLNPVFEARLRSTLNTDHRSVAGLMSPALNADPGTDTNGFYFRKTFASTTWAAIVRTGGAECLTNTGISTDIFRELRVEVDNAAPAAYFLIDDAIVATYTSASGVCFPTTTSTFGFYIGNEINGAADRATDIDYFRVWSDDPPEISSVAREYRDATTGYVYDPVQGADISESYLSSDARNLAPGTVVALDREKKTSVRRSNGVYDKDVFGVITTSPGMELGGQVGDVVGVGLMGRLPVKVNLRGGPIGIGDWITSSDEPGVAMRAGAGGVVLGRALEPYDGTTTSTILATIEVSSRVGEGVISAVTSTELSWKDAASAVMARSIRTAQELVGGFFDMLVAQVASIGKLFVHTATILPNGSLSIPSGPREMSGRATVPAGVADVFIESTRVTSSSKIFVSPLVPLTAPLVVTEKKEGQGFRVSFSSAQGIPAPFDWILFEGYGGGDESVVSGASAAIAPSVSPPLPPPPPPPTPISSEENASSSDISLVTASSSDPIPIEVEASSTEPAPLL